MSPFIRCVMLAVCVGSVASGACFEPVDSGVGTVSLNLVGQTPSGSTYRLRDAVLAVNGPAYSETWDTEDDPERTSLSADVDQGEYEVELEEGWRLERLAPPEPPVTVEAALLSDNPLAFTVEAGARTRVPLRFRVEDGDVELDQGYDIEIEVEEPTVPAVTIAPLASPTNDSTPTIAFTVAADGAVSITCRIDGGAFAACTSPYTTPALADGVHTIGVRATDGMGRFGEATTTFAVDTTPPTVSLAGNPAVTSDATPTLSFATAGSPVELRCRFDGGAYVPCQTPTSHTAPSALADGAHTFQVRVSDAAGNIATASFAFTVDTAAPNVIITSGPTQTVYGATATFAFSTSGSPTSVQCRSYARGAPSGAYVSCTSPVAWAVQLPVYPETYAPWTFEVQVTDAAGNARSATWDYATGLVI